jgi:hypothetical protein
VSRDRTFFKPAGDTFILLIGAQRIEGGVLAGVGARAQWRDGSVFEAAIDTDDGAGLPMDVLAAALQRVQSLPAGAVMRVLVADNWLAAATVPWNPAMQRPAGMAAAARGRLAAAGFRIGPGDTVRVDEAPFGVPRLVLTYPAALIDVLSLAAARLDARLASVLSLSVAGWALARRNGNGAQSALALLDGKMITVARGTGGARARLNELTIRTGIGAPETARHSLHALWQRLCLRDPQLVSVAGVALLDLGTRHGSAPVSARPFVVLDIPAPGRGPAATPGLCLAAATRLRRDPLDALAGGSPMSARRTLLLAGAALLAVAMVVQAVQAARSVRRLQAGLVSTARGTAAAPRPVNWSREELVRVQAVNVAIRELNLPFSAILRALEPPPDLRVAVLAVTTAASKSGAQPSSVKIVAEARTGAEMARYVAFLAERRPFTGAYLTEHEIDETSAERPYRFTLEASWSD